MKKIIVLILSCVLVMAMFSGCTIGKCDFCGKSGVVSRRSVFGTTVNICSDCD